MKTIKQLVIGLLAIAAMAAALILSDKYLSRDIEGYSDQGHNPSNRLQKIRDGMLEK